MEAVKAEAAKEEVETGAAVAVKGGVAKAGGA